MLHYRISSRMFSYIDIDGAKIPCTYFPNQNLMEAMEKTGHGAPCYQEKFRLFYCDTDPLKGYFVFFFYNPVLNGDIPLSCFAASPADTANFMHEFYSDYHAPMIKQADIMRMEDAAYRKRVQSAAEQMIMSILSLKLTEVTAGQCVLDVSRIPAPLMEYLESLHPFYVTFKGNFYSRKQRASYAGRYLRIDAHTKAAVEEYLLENGLYDEADCIMDEAVYNRVRNDKKMRREMKKALKNYPDIRKTAPAAHIIHDRPVFHIEETGALSFDFHALDEKASRFQAILGLTEEERNEALFKTIGQRERLF